MHECCIYIEEKLDSHKLELKGLGVLLTDLVGDVEQKCSKTHLISKSLSRNHNSAYLR